jgi:carbonic anhydrase
MKRSIIGFLQEITSMTLVLSCMDFQTELNKITNSRVSVMTVLGMDLQRCCPETLQSVARTIESQRIRQVILLEHHCCQVHENLLTDFDKKARWIDFSEKLRDMRLQLHDDGVNLVDSRKFALSHTRNQLIFLVDFLQHYGWEQPIAQPTVRGLVSDPALGFTELINIVITGFRN